jgi:PAS domain S-box-containing protein
MSTSDWHLPDRPDVVTMVGGTSISSGAGKTEAQLQRRVSVGVAIGVLVIGAMGVLSWRIGQQAAQDSRWVTHTYDVTGTMELTLRHLDDVETGARGFVLTGQDQFLQPYKVGRYAVQLDLERLRLLTGDNSEQQRRLGVLVEQVRNKLDQAAVLVATRRHPAENSTLANLYDDKRLMDSVRGTIAEMEAAEKRLLELRIQRSKQTERATSFAFLFCSLTGASFVSVAGAVINRETRAASRSHAQVKVLNAELERKVAERTHSEARYRGLLEAAPDATVVVNQDGRIVLFNAQAERQFGYQRDELFGQKITRIIPEGLAERLIADGTRTPADGPAKQTGVGIELSGQRKDGDRFPIEIMLSPLESPEGILVTAAIRNISERKKSERDKANLRDQAAALEAAHNELELRVEERTRELAASNRILERSNIELQQFAYIASHDLLSPLRSIGGFVQLLKIKYQGTPDEQANDWIHRTVQAIGQMQALIRDLLAYSRVDSRFRPFVATSFLDVFHDAVKLLEPSIREVQGQVTCAELPVIMGDRSQLVQLMDNLIGNGLKYHGDRAPRVHVSAERNGEEWNFSVCDNGIGIAPEYYERIFEIFQRLHDKEEYPGTGIGLAVCRRIVDGHGGRIWVESEPGQGSAFHFTIPAVQKET